MTEGGPPRQKRGLKTWSSLGQLGCIPSEYEIVTHNLNYTTRPNRTAALESNPTTAANMWLVTYRDKSLLRADDWRGFRDPDEMTYRKYVTMQDEQETAVERVLDEYGSAGHDASLPAPWVACLATLFTPTRFPVHALQMCTAYLGHMAPASYISNCAVFGPATCCGGCPWSPTGRGSSPTPGRPQAKPNGACGSGTRHGSRPGKRLRGC